MSRLYDTPAYSTLPLPKTGTGMLGPAQTTGGLATQPAPLEGPIPTPATGTGPTPGANPPALDALGGFLDQSVFGIPVKWLLIGAAAWFMLKR